MNLPQTGGCKCGKVRYEITQKPLLVYTCHCLDCQRLTISAFSLGVVVPEAGFRLAAIDPRPLKRVADSGRRCEKFPRVPEKGESRVGSLSRAMPKGPSYGVCLFRQLLPDRKLIAPARAHSSAGPPAVHRARLRRARAENPPGMA